MSQGASYPDLKGRRVFITGAASGIGAEALWAFARQGAVTGFIDLQAESGEDLCDEVEAKTGARPWFRPVDVLEVEALQDAIRSFAAKAGGLDVLVNNVGNDTRHEVLSVEPSSWRRSLSINLDAHFFACQAAIPSMQKMGGSIINLSSIVATIGMINMPCYVSAKSALLGLTRSLAREFGPEKIRVNAVLPGMVLTERQLELWITPEHEAAWMEDTPLKERLLPKHIADLLLFLGSSSSCMITNQTFVIDGGKS